MVMKSNFEIADSKQGPQLANEVLYLNRKLNAKEAFAARFVASVEKKEELLPKTLAVAKVLAGSPPESLRDSKRVSEIHKMKSDVVLVGETKRSHSTIGKSKCSRS